MLMKVVPSLHAGDDGGVIPAAPPTHVRHISLRSWTKVIGTWFARYRQRHDLAELDDRMLKDIGVTRDQASHEIDKPFWMA